MKFIFLLAAVSITTFSMSKNTGVGFDTLFSAISSDTLQVFVSRYRTNSKQNTWTRTAIPSDLLKAYHINLEGCVALGKLYFNTNKEMIGYLLGNKDGNNIFLYIYQKNNLQPVFEQIVASNGCLVSSHL